ncbi:MAG: tripartite tricarboxylate transporter TctB family protein [Peptococcaceae bacterium]
MTIRKSFSIIMAAISLAGITGSFSLRMVRGTSLGPGMMPLIYSILLLILAAIFFIQKDNSEKIDWKALMQPPVIEGIIFYVLNLVMLLLFYLFGTVASMAIFCIAAQLMLKRMRWKKAVLFSVVWVAALYTLFVLVLQIPFETGILTEAFMKAFIY